MPGSFTIRPIEANLTRDTGVIGKMSPYCEFKVGDFTAKSATCKKGGMHPQWHDAITIPAPSKLDSLLNINVLGKSTILNDDLLGVASLDLNELRTAESGSKWYPIFFEDKPAGELLLESTFDEISQASTSDFIEEKALLHSGVIGLEPEVRVFQEQRQVIENQTFSKDVDEVEIRSKMQNIEVMEPVKTMKDVQYTEVVPVMKQIETVEPQVVTRQIEVIEPQLVTKTIQVVENVPVMKEVEVIESIPVMKEVETMEPRTFTKQVEVTDYVPVTKQVEVTEPVHLKKTVEYVEPVITTQTITKEIKEPVIVNEETTTSVGPATLVGEQKIFKDLGQRTEKKYY